MQVCGHLVQEAEVRVRPAQSQPQDCLQGELQVRGPGEVSSQPGSHHAAAGRGVLEVTHIFNRFFPWYDGKSLDSWNTISYLLLLRDRNMKMSQSVIPSIYELSLAKSQEMNGCGIFSLFFYFLGLTNSSSSRFQFSSLYLTSSTGLLLYSRESIEKEQWYNIVGWRRQVNLYVFQKKKRLRF